MQQIRQNPYRTVGLLVGATAREQERQVRRLKQFIEAEQEPQDDFSFPVLGKIERSVDSVTEAASKLNLDSDKMNAALFWFYKGNEITDEPAFDALKDADLRSSVEIWKKLTATDEVTRRNSSAFQNLSTVLLCHAFNGTGINAKFLEQGVLLKLKFLESDLIKEFKALATDETFKITNKDLQLQFLHQVQTEIERKGELDSSKFFEIINKAEFSAKQEFLKGFAQAPIKQIENYIAETKAKRKETPWDAEIHGNELYDSTAGLIEQLYEILGEDDIKYQVIADKLSAEILQCGIVFFKEYKDEEYDPSEKAMALFDNASYLAVGNVAKQRCQENIENLQEWIDDSEDRERLRLIRSDLEFLTNELENFSELPDTIENAKAFVDDCKPKMLNIKNALGSSDDFYIKISSAVVSKAQDMVVSAVNKEVKNVSSVSFISDGYTSIALNSTVTSALDVTYKLGSFDMYHNLRTHYNKNMDSLKLIAKQIGINSMHPKVRIEKILHYTELRFRGTQKEVFFQAEINEAKAEMNRIKEWQFLRSESEKERQIREQQKKIDELLVKSEQEKKSQLKNQQRAIDKLKLELQQIDY